MIRYALSCDNDHSFDSWFQSAEAFDTLVGARMVSCAVCRSKQVKKQIMAPGIGKASQHVEPARPLSQPASVAEQAMKDLRTKIEASADDVGTDFASEARKIHAGDAPERAIFGEARLKDAKSLIDDGIPVAPLPFLPTRKAH